MRRNGFRYDPYRPRINTCTVSRVEVVADSNVRRREAFVNILAEAMKNQTPVPPEVWETMTKREKRAHRCNTFRKVRDDSWAKAENLYA